MGPTGPSGKNPSTAASSNTPQTTDMYSSRGFGELGSTKKKDELLKSQMSESNYHFDESDSDNNDELNNRKEDETEEPKVMNCPNCQQEISREQAAAHTVMCYRNSTKCKVCSKVILKTKKKEHLIYWRDPVGLLKSI